VEDADESQEVSNATTASANPPLFYLLQAPVYWANPSNDLLDKLLPMRLLSALFGAITVLAIFLFLRELLPASPWLWPAGALACAFHPGFGFISGGINPDSLLFALGAVTFWLMAMILRRGPTPMRAAGLAAVVAAGVLTKPLFIGLAPAAAVALLVATVRKRRQGAGLRTAVIPLGVGAVVFAIPLIAYELIGRVAFDHPYFAEGRSVGGTVGTSAGSLADEISYVWQLWLPRLPWQFDQFPGAFPLDDTWLNGFVGQFGWLDYAFAPPVHDWAVRIGLVLLLAAAISLFVNRARMRGRWLELAVYVAAAAGIAIAIGSQDYSVTESGGTVRFTQARYLMPLLALYAGLVAVALHLGRRRVGPYLAVAVVAIAAVHALSGMLLTVGRYYI
jgi:4-amino-4-deoxy-L-arabinose transferase-like glycosyltransferase